MPTSFRHLAGIPDSVATVSDTILIIIDAQNEYVEGALSVDGISTSRPAIASLLERYRCSNGKIVHVKHEVPTGTPVFTPGTHLADEFEELKPAGGNDNEVTIMKKFPSSFAETELEDVLKKWSAKKLLLVGYMAHVCVSTTARDGNQRGYDILVARDAVGDRSLPADRSAEAVSGEQVTQMVMTELGDTFATIINSQDVQ